MLNLFSKLIFFYFAYLPLFLIIVIQNMKLSCYTFLIILGIILIGFPFIFVLLRAIKDVAPRKEQFRLIANKNSEILNFIITYIIPFAMHFHSINDWLSFGLLFFIIAYLYLDTPIFCINPLLKIIFRYNIYLVEQNNKEYYLLSKRSYFRNGYYALNIVPLTTSLIMEAEESED